MGYCIFDTPFGQMAAQGEEKLTHLHLPKRPLPNLPVAENPLLRETQRQVLAYLAGRLRSFDLPLDAQGTPFREKVWAALLEIPFGELWSYRKLAEVVGQPKAARAVGQANHNNPIPIIIPCHRVLGISGRLTGYAGGLPLKQSLLELEGHRFFLDDPG